MDGSVASHLAYLMGPEILHWMARGDFREASKRKPLYRQVFTLEDVGKIPYGRNRVTLDDMVALRPDFPPSTMFPLRMSDCCRETDRLTISSSRLAGRPTLTMLYPRVNRLHPPYYRSCLRHDGPWDAKEDGIFWRGVDSGNILLNRIDLPGRSNRWEWCQAWDGYKGSSDERPWDLGITRFAQSDAAFHPKGLIHGLEGKAKGKTSVHRLIRSKYTLCLEGNDVSSQFMWALAGQTLPLHPYPFYFETTWFHGPVYDRPEPWVHFVPLNHDGSDLASKYEWCLNHEDRVKDMVAAGAAHAGRFLDDEFFLASRQAFVGAYALEGPK